MKFFAGVLVAVFALAALTTTAMASGVGIDVKERATGSDYGITTNPVQMCTGPLTVREVLVTISNTGASTDSYKLSLQDMPAGWTGQIQQDVMLASGESRSLDLFVVNNYYTPSGTYFFTIKAVSNTNPSDSVAKRLQVNILPCFNLLLTSDTTSRDACQETATDATYSLTLRNTGKFRDTIDISAPSTVSLDKNSVTLDPEQGTVITATMASRGLQGMNYATILAKSRGSQSSANVTLALNVKDCYSSTASIQPESATGCIGKSSTFTLAIKNTGNTDNYKISVPSWAHSDATNILLESGASRDITITASPEAAGKASLDVSIDSSDSPSTKKVSATLESSECRDIVVLASPASSTTCRGGVVAYDVTVKNRGILEDTVTLSATAGSLSANKLTLAAGQSQTVQLNVDTSSLSAGKNTVEVVASDGKVSDKSTVDVNVDNCFSSSVEVEPNNKTICPFTGFNYTIKLTNTGRNADSFVVRFRDVSETASLAAGQSTSWSIPVYSEEAGVYSLTASAASNNSQSNATAVLIVQSAGKCYAVDLTAASPNIPAKVNEASTAKITVKNSGSVSDDYSVSVAGPSWAYVAPSSLSLEPGVSGDVYLYLQPPKEADNSSVKITVNARSNHAAGSIAVNALVGNQGGLGGISLSNITGAIISDDSIDRPFWKLAVVAIIALAIVIILIVRFVLLVKG